VRRVAAELKAALGEVTNPMMVAAIRRAAELSVIAADLRARRLRGEPVDIGELVKAENAARRAVADLGIKPGKAAVPSLADHLARRVAERAGERSGGLA
jgi:hypothetical protein